MEVIEEVEARREAILEEIRGMRSMRRGTVNEQYAKVSHKGKKDPVLRGPYYVLSRNEGGKTVGWRLKTPEEVEQAKEDVAAYRHFKGLCKEFEELTEKLGELERASGKGSKKNARGRDRRGSGGAANR